VGAAAGNPRRADLLATVASAQRWLAAATSAWADAAGVPAAALAGPLSSADLDEVVALRAAVFAAVTGSDAAETDQALDPTSVEAAIDAHGVVHLSSGGRASDLLRGRVLIEMYNAQLIGTWRRLKVCHNARCHEVFFNQSKNNSRTWFDTAACANALNLRAYRERRKAARFSDLSERDPG
jgi:predicted RNA-binding Zn ribbon-like protein